MERQRVCCNCRHNIRTEVDNHIECRCEIDGEYLPYLTVMNHWCRRWAKENGQDIRKVNGTRIYT